MQFIRLAIFGTPKEAGLARELLAQNGVAVRCQPPHEAKIDNNSTAIEVRIPRDKVQIARSLLEASHL